MKKIIPSLRLYALVIFCLLFSINFLTAQIIFQSTNYAIPGDSFLVSISPESALPMYNFDTTGTNFSWKFDTLDAITQQYKLEENPDATGYLAGFLVGIPYIIPGCIEQCTDLGGGLIPCTNGCNTEWNQLTNAVLSWDTINLQALQIYDLYNFFSNTGTTYEKNLIGYKVNVSGITGSLTTQFNSPDIIYKFPLALSNKDSSESDYIIDLGLPFVYSHWQKRVNEVDGWGSLKTPFGTFTNTLRVKSSIHNIDKFYFDTGDSLDLSAILPDSTIEYKWFDLNYGIPVLTVTAKIFNGEKINIKAEYIDSLRCLHPIPLFGYLPIPTYLDLSNDSVEVNFYSFASNCDSLHWNFGDTTSGIDNFSGISHPSHWYTSQGIYITELIGCNSSPTCDSMICDTFKLPVAVIDTSSVYANFVAKPLFPCGGDTVFFTNTSVNDTAWFWDFKDGVTDTAETPFHIYSSSGSYDVMLIAYNGFQSDTAIKTVIVESTPVAGFTFSDTLTLVPVQFNNTSTGVDTSSSYLWTFGGGTPSIHFSNLENPLLTFQNPGIAKVCLLSMNSLGCSNTVCDSLIVYECLNTKFKTSGLSASFCSNSTITLTNQTSSDLTNTISYQWLSDGILFSSATNTSVSFSTEGEHTISLISDNGLCSDTLVKTVFIKTPAVLYSAGNDTSICLGDSVQLNPDYTTGGQLGATLNWSPSDGLSATNIPGPYAKPDSTMMYIFTLNIVGGTCNPLFSDKDTVEINVVDDAVVADFGPYGSFINQFTFTFADSSDGATYWYWNFGDGGSDSVQNPTHTFSDMTIFYTVTLIAGNVCGSDTVSHNLDLYSGGISEFSSLTNLKVFPNPFHKITSLSYSLNENSDVLIEVFNAIGEKVLLVTDQKQLAGNYHFEINPSEQRIHTGTYFLRIKINGRQIIMPLVEM